MSTDFVLKFFLIFIFSLNCSVTHTCKSNSTSNVFVEPFIAGGYRPVNLSLAKYVVSLRRREETEKRFGYTHFCAGSIISKKKILTAAHCFYRKREKISSRDYKVVAKTPNRLNKISKTLEVKVKQVILHPDYTEDTIFNDIGIIILQRDIDLESDWAAIIPLTKKSFKPGTLCQVVGWGRLYKHGPLANEIVHVKLTLHSRKYCRKTYPHFSGKKLCASSKDDKEKDVCNGDSGGPMICEGALTGIVSYGYGCASGHAGIYTNVIKYLDWINNNGEILPRPTVFLYIKSLLLFLLL